MKITEHDIAYLIREELEFMLERGPQKLKQTKKSAGDQTGPGGQSEFKAPRVIDDPLSPEEKAKAELSKTLDKGIQSQATVTGGGRLFGASPFRSSYSLTAAPSLSDPYGGGTFRGQLGGTVDRSARGRTWAGNVSIGQSAQARGSMPAGTPELSGVQLKTQKTRQLPKFARDHARFGTQSTFQLTPGAQTETGERDPFQLTYDVGGIAGLKAPKWFQSYTPQLTAGARGTLGGVPGRERSYFTPYVGFQLPKGLAGVEWQPTLTGEKRGFGTPTFKVDAGKVLQTINPWAQKGDGQTTSENIMKITEHDIVYLIREQVNSIFGEAVEPKQQKIHPKEIPGAVGGLQMENAVLNAQVAVFNEVIGEIGGALGAGAPPEMLPQLVGEVIGSLGDRMDKAIKDAQKELT